MWKGKDLSSAPRDDTSRTLAMLATVSGGTAFGTAFAIAQRAKLRSPEFAVCVVAALVGAVIVAVGLWVSGTRVMAAIARRQGTFTMAWTRVLPWMLAALFVCGGAAALVNALFMQSLIGLFFR